MRVARLAAVLALVLIAATACRNPTEPTDPSLTRITGTVQFVSVEGGFWAIRGSDNVTYDPLGGLPAAFRQEGLRVVVDGRIRNDMASIHMAGPILEIVRITKG